MHIEKILRKVNECMSFLIRDEKLLQKYNETWKKVGNIKKDFDSKAVCNTKCLKTENLIMEKSTQIFLIIKYKKMALNLFLYQ